MNSDFGSREIAARLYNDALDHIDVGDLTSAAGSLKIAVLLDKKSNEYAALLGLCYFALGNFQNAGSCWEQKHTEDSDYLQLINSSDFKDYAESYDRCIDLIGENKILKAFTVLDKCKSKVPNVTGYNLLGLLSYDLGMSKNAIDMWKKALEINNADKDAVKYILDCRRRVIPTVLERIYRGAIKFAGKIGLL